MFVWGVWRVPGTAGNMLKLGSFIRIPLCLSSNRLFGVIDSPPRCVAQNEQTAVVSIRVRRAKIAVCAAWRNDRNMYDDGIRVKKSAVPKHCAFTLYIPNEKA
jgi:hypothetical protein